MNTVTLRATCLFSKFGFGDGDMLDDVLYDTKYEPLMMTERPEDKHLFFKHEVLARLVERRLIPALPVRVEVYRIGTNHNPIRAATCSDAAEAAVENCKVTITHDDVLRVAEEVREEWGLHA